MLRHHIVHLRTPLQILTQRVVVESQLLVVLPQILHGAVVEVVVAGHLDQVEGR